MLGMTMRKGLLMTNEEIIEQIKNGVNVQENYYLLFKQNEPLISILCRKYIQFGELEDLMQEAFLTLYEAVEKYDSEKDVKFMSYYPFVLKKHINNYIMQGSNVHIPLYMRYKIYKYQRLAHEYFTETGTEITDNTCCNLLGVSAKELREIKNYAVAFQMDSLDKTPDSDDTMKKVDTIPDSNDYLEDIIDSVYQKQLHDEITNTLNHVKENDAYILTKRYLEGMNCQEIADDLGISVTRVRQKIDKALNNIRKSKYSDTLKNFLYEEESIISKAYKSGWSKFERNGSNTENCAIKMYEKEKEYTFFSTINDIVFLMKLLDYYENLKKQGNNKNNGDLDNTITQIKRQIDSLSMKKISV